MLCVVGQFDDMTVVAVWRSVTGTVVNVEIRERHVYLQSLFGQFNDMVIFW